MLFIYFVTRKPKKLKIEIKQYTSVKYSIIIKDILNTTDNTNMTIES